MVCVARDQVRNIQTLMELASSDKEHFSSRQRKTALLLTEEMPHHPRMRRFVENLVVHAYERKNGRIVGAIDWQKVWDWFITNGPAILDALLKIIAFLMAIV